MVVEKYCIATNSSYIGGQNAQHQLADFCFQPYRSHMRIFVMKQSRLYATLFNDPDVVYALLCETGV